MPDLFDQLAPDAPAPKGDVFDQLSPEKPLLANMRAKQQQLSPADWQAKAEALEAARQTGRPIIPANVSPEMLKQAQAMAQANTPQPDQGAVHNFTAGALGNLSGTAAGLEGLGQLGAQAVGWQGGATGFQQMAANTRGYQPDAGSWAGTAGSVAGALPALGSGVGGLTQTVSNAVLGTADTADAAQRAGKIGYGQEALNIVGQGLIQAAAAKFGQANLAGKFTKAMMPEIQASALALAQRLAARGTIDASQQVIQGVASAAVQKYTGVEPDAKLWDWKRAAQEAAGGAAQGVVGGAVHEAFGEHPASPEPAQAAQQANAPSAPKAGGDIFDQVQWEAPGGQKVAEGQRLPSEGERVNVPPRTAAEAEPDKTAEFEKSLGLAPGSAKIEAPPAEATAEHPEALATAERIRQGQIAADQEAPKRRAGDRDFTPDEDRELIRQTILNKDKENPAFGQRASDWQYLDQNKKTLLQELRERQIAKEAAMPPKERADFTAKRLAAREPLFQNIPAEEGPTAPGEFGTRNTPAREARLPITEEMKQTQAAKEEGTAPAAEPKRPVPNADVQAHAAAYTKAAGIDYKPNSEYAQVDPQRASRIAEDYAAMKHDPNDPKVKASYDAFKKETLAQYNFLKDQGVKFEPSKENPYPDSKAMAKDVSENKHLAFYTGGTMSADHPLAEKIPGEDISYNDAFRAVHDYFGHAKEGYGFGPRGEENAWRQHSQMYSPAARGAMTAETRGQNSWVNFGPHGEANRANPSNTIYAEQKAGLLPEEHTRLSAPPIAPRNRGVIDLTPLHNLAEQDIRPAVKEAGTLVHEAYHGLSSAFGMQRGDEADIARGILRNRGAELQRRLDQLHAGLDRSITLIDRTLSKADMHASTDAWEAGQPQPDKELQPIVDTVKDLQEKAWDEISGMGATHQLGYIEDYYRHQFKNPDRAGTALSEMMARRPLEGNTGYRKQRKIPTMAEARQLGLEAVEDNPIRNGLMALHNMNKYITAHQAADEMTKNGLLKDVPKGDSVPDGWDKIKDSVFKGKMAPTTVADLTNNLLDPGLTGSKTTGNLARKVLGAGNTVNTFQLGINLFHAMKTGFEAWKSEGAQGTRELLNAPSNAAQGEFGKVAGNLGAAAKHYAFAATGLGPVIRDFMEGSKIRKEWLSPGSTDPDTAALVNVLKDAGHRATGDRDYIPGAIENMKKAWHQDNPLGAAWRLPFAALEKASEPIMKHLVPLVKNGVAAEMVRSEMADLGPGADVNTIRKTLGKALDSVDNRFGQMVNDNLFWNKSLRQIGQLMTRSLPYQVGTVREYGGAIRDITKAAVQGAQGQNPTGLKSNRLAYAMTSPLMAGIAGGLVTYGLTGKAPKNLLDYLMPNTGRTDSDGKPVRLKLPNYENDVVEFTSDPIKTIKSKMSGLVGVLAGLAANQDYRNVQIANPKDSALTGLGKRALWTAKQFEPISVQNLRKMVQQGAGSESVLPFLGISQAPRGVDDTAAEALAHQYVDQKNTSPRTQEDADRESKINQLASGFRQRSPTALADLRQAQGLSFKDRQAVIKRGNEPGGLLGALKTLTPDEAMNVWGKATPEERKTIQFAMRKKVVAADKEQSWKTEQINQIQSDMVGAK